MNDQNETDHIGLWKSLDRWHGVVEHMVRKGRVPRGLTDDAYCQLHRDLLTHLRAAPSEELRPSDPICQTLHRSVRPWVNLDSLSRSDKRVLRMLEEEIRLIRSKLMPRRQWRALVLQRACVLLFVVVIAAIIIGSLRPGAPRVSMVADSIDSAWQYFEGLRAQLWLGVTQSSTDQRLVALAGSMVVLGLFFLRDPKRSKR